MTVSHGPVTQVAWVTDDLDALEQLLSSQFGVPRWTRLPGIEFGPGTCTFRGQPADVVADVSLAYSGDLQLELIRPVRGDSIYTEFLAAHGSGLHHVCFEVEDMAVALQQATEAGLEVLQAGSMAGGLMEFAYVDGSSAGAPYVELARVSPEMRAFFDQLKQG